MTETRRLAAIVSADVAGYSRLMGADEAGTLAALKAIRRDVADPRVAEHHGRIVKTTGDGLLLEFASVVDAVRCAIAVQTAMADHARAQSEDRRIAFRFGINVGDIISDGDDIFGDSVNVAARLQEIATPGGICLSHAAREQVGDRLDAAFQDGGEQSLKNIVRPVRVWRWTGAVVALAVPTGTAPLALPDKPSIAVLPFANLSGDPKQEYLVDGIVEDILTALSRFKQLFVIARNSSFTYKGRAVDVKQVGRELGVRYVLEGSRRKAASRIRITAQLVDAVSGKHLWADRFDGAIEDIFDLQDRVAASVAGAIAPRLERVEFDRVLRKPTGNLDAYDCLLRGRALFERSSEGNHGDGLPLFLQAIALDPNFAAAYAMASYAHASKISVGRFDARDAPEALRLTRAALQLGKDDAECLAYGAFALAYIARDLVAAAEIVGEAIAVNPNLAAAWGFSGWIHVWLGEPEPALEHFGRSMRLSPLDVGIHLMRVGAAHACFFAGRYDEALSWAMTSLVGRPKSQAALRIAATSEALAGHLVEASHYRERLQAANPTLRVSTLAAALGPYRDPACIAKYAEGLRLAGLPE